MTQIHIDEAYPKNTWYPMLVNFQNGCITDNFMSQHIVLLENSKTGTKTFATEIDGLLYAGDEENEGLGKTFILARDEITEKVRIIESGVVSMKPILNVKVNETQPLETNNLEFSRKFGSKKNKQRMELLERLKVNVETVTEQMKNVAEQISEDKVDLSSYNKADGDDFYIPPIDRTADTVDGVYDIDKILTEKQYDKIYSELDGKDYVSDMVPFVKSMANKNLSPKHIVLAVYANALLQLYSTVVKEITKKAFTICPLSPTLNEYILNNFLSASNLKRTRPAAFKDKSLCYAIVLLLLINNYKIEMEGLCEALKLTPNTASMKVRVTGASVITSGSKKMVQLKLPLNKTGFKRRSAKFQINF